MDAIKALNTNEEFQADELATPIVELSDLQLAYVGGGSGDVVL